MEVLIRDFYCYECSLQFDTKYVFDVHLSVVHGKKLDIKQEPYSQALVIPETQEPEHPREEISWKNQSIRRRTASTSGHKETEPFKCDICNAEFTSKHVMKGHIATIHEGTS